MARLSLLSIPLVVAAAFGAAHADKFTHKAEVKPTVTLTNRTRPAPRRVEPAAPTVSATDILFIQGLVGAIRPSRSRCSRTT